jgi:hypothetical protein
VLEVKRQQQSHHARARIGAGKLPRSGRYDLVVGEPKRKQLELVVRSQTAHSALGPSQLRHQRTTPATRF